SFRRMEERRVSESADEAWLLCVAVSRDMHGTWVPPVSDAVGGIEPDVHESGWNYAAGVRVLRLLRAVWMHDRSESAADEYVASGDREEEKRGDSDRRNGAANCAREEWRRCESDRRQLHRRQRRGVFSACRD